jgi:hypothetical protein
MRTVVATSKTGFNSFERERVPCSAYRQTAGFLLLPRGSCRRKESPLIRAKQFRQTSETIRDLQSRARTCRARSYAMWLPVATASFWPNIGPNTPIAPGVQTEVNRRCRIDSVGVAMVAQCHETQCHEMQQSSCRRRPKQSRWSLTAGQHG